MSEEIKNRTLGEIAELAWPKFKAAIAAAEKAERDADAAAYREVFPPRIPPPNPSQGGTMVCIWHRNGEPEIYSLEERYTSLAKRLDASQLEPTAQKEGT